MCQHVQFSLHDMIVITDEKMACSIGLFNKQRKRKKSTANICLHTYMVDMGYLNRAHAFLLILYYEIEMI